MMGMRRLSIATLGALALVAACGGQPRGAAEAPSALEGADAGQCLDRGVPCKDSRDCCSHWCVSATCHDAVVSRNVRSQEPRLTPAASASW
jgi:hypothetical protein